MAFNPEDCAIPTYYCGDKDVVPARKRGDDKYYTRKGTPRECLSKGFGAGMFIERAKNTPKTSLQQIKYVGEVYEQRFIEEDIRSLDALILRTGNIGVGALETLLKKVLKKKTGVLDKRAYNSTLLWLHNNGQRRIPQCDRIDP